MVKIRSLIDVVVVVIVVVVAIVVVVVDFVELLNPKIYLQSFIKIGSITAEILPTLSSWWVVVGGGWVDQSHFWLSWGCDNFL